ncbi:hypothetical protein [Vibrio quintilis]|uniref:Uncharacterized protein n=1 Tax=Vibrio quintilis TaxID=1117707 RepID=A0A1M7YQE0_9VIBR|nr:hypothetical protein [Vibrio quintilis]SHO54736.1 hypothetical protein VQ7734_00454 [Vibrio quintilis]
MDVAVENKADEIKADETNVVPQTKKKRAFYKTTIWLTVVMVYMILVTVVGYIAFYDQDFNNPTNTLNAYVHVLQDQADAGKTLPKAMNEVVVQMMKSEVENDEGLQELATQSFNIILGGLLAFLSASAAMVFRND